MIADWLAGMVLAIPVRMPRNRLLAPSLAALLSLGFMSQSPVGDQSVRRIAGVDCIDCGTIPLPTVQSPLPANLAQHVSANATLTGTELFALYARQLEINQRLFSVNPILVPGAMAFYRPFGQPAPTFPSYALPGLRDIRLVKPHSSWQIFGGLMSDPALRHLVTPSAPAPSQTVGAVLGSQDTSAPLPGPTVENRALTGDLLVPKSQDRIAQEHRTSSLVGSRPVPREQRPEVQFTVNGAAAPAGFFRAPGSPMPKPVAATEPNNSPNPVRDAIIRHSFVR